MLAWGNHSVHEGYITRFHALHYTHATVWHGKVAAEWMFASAVSLNSMLWQRAGLVHFPSTRGKGPRDAISAKLQVVRNLTLKGKENPSKETWLPLLPPGSFRKQSFHSRVSNWLEGQFCSYLLRLTLLIWTHSSVTQNFITSQYFINTSP